MNNFIALALKPLISVQLRLSQYLLLREEILDISNNVESKSVGQLNLLKVQSQHLRVLEGSVDHNQSQCDLRTHHHPCDSTPKG
ncbi:hypothetical protein J6590_094960 [Homalodisca vitripennis]|nr:hypothetical protein J6590_094960 [Homalodisca vitripennis]